MRTVVDITHPSIDSESQGNKELETIVSLSITKTDPKTPVKTMNRKRRAIGFTRGVAEFSADLEVVLYPTDPEVDWDALQTSGEVFGMSYERGDNGDRYAMVDCIVGDISEPYSEGGETRMSVKINFLDLKKE